MSLSSDVINEIKVKKLNSIVSILRGVILTTEIAIIISKILYQ